MGVILLSGCSIHKHSNYLDITCLNVGKADAIVVRTKNHCYLIDTGTSSTTQELKSFLDENKIETIDGLILTHFDKDHIGGAALVISDYNVLNVYTPDYTEDSEEYNAFIQAVNSKKQAVTTVTQQMKFEIDNVKFTIYPPDKDRYDDDNNYSLVTYAVCSDADFLFMGDAVKKRVKEILRYDISNVTFLKVPHHGSVEDNTKEMFKRENPKYAVISNDRNNIEDVDKLEKILDNLSTDYYYTGNGSIHIECDGSKNLKISQ